MKKVFIYVVVGFLFILSVLSLSGIFVMSGRVVGGVSPFMLSLFFLSPFIFLFFFLFRIKKIEKYNVNQKLKWRYIVRIIFVFLVLLLLVFSSLFGTPVKHLKYWKAYSSEKFPYKICNELDACEVKRGEMFAVNWFYTETNDCLLNRERLFPIPGGSPGTMKYRLGDGVVRTNKIEQMKQNRSHFYNCPIRYYDLFLTEGDGESYYLYRDFDHYSGSERDYTKIIEIKIIE